MSRSALAVLGPAGPQLRDPAAPLLRADDLGVLRGESVFETVRVAGRAPAFLERHLARLEVSAARLALDLPSGWPGLARLAVDAYADQGDPGEDAAAGSPDDGGEPHAVLRLVCTRGGVAYALVTPAPPQARAGREQGVRAVTLTLGVPAGVRAQAPWLLGGVKSTSYAVNMAALRAAAADGAEEAVFLSSDGEVLEAPTSTVAWVRDGELVTPPAGEVGILPGTTMEVVLDLCRELAVPATVRRGGGAELAQADEVLLASSIRGVAPVVQLDGRPLGTGAVTARLRAAFEQRVQALCLEHG